MIMMKTGNKETDILEDEFHFILECPIYQHLRKIYLGEFYWKRSKIPRFIQPLISEDKTIPRKLSKFVHKSFKLKGDLYYK